MNGAQSTHLHLLVSLESAHKNAHTCDMLRANTAYMQKAVFPQPEYVTRVSLAMSWEQYPFSQILANCSFPLSANVIQVNHQSWCMYLVLCIIYYLDKPIHNILTVKSALRIDITVNLSCNCWANNILIANFYVDTCAMLTSFLSFTSRQIVCMDNSVFFLNLVFPCIIV